MLALLLVFQVLQGCSTSDVTAVAQPPTDAWVIGNVPPSPGMQRVLGTKEFAATLKMERGRYRVKRGRPVISV